MIIDNREQIAKMLSFNEDDFYFAQVIKRRRENPNMAKGSMILNSFYIESMEDYYKKVTRMIEICNYENARIYFRLNKRNYKTLGLKMIKRIADLMANGNEHSLKTLFETVAGENYAEKDRKWLVDVDWEMFDPDNMPRLTNTLTELQRGRDWEPMVETIPTKNGCHLITRPFNVMKFKDHYLVDMVHKEDATTLLYCP